jgi:FAD/FMN-containing dehydrogenase
LRKKMAEGSLLSGGHAGGMMARFSRGRLPHGDAPPLPPRCQLLAGSEGTLFVGVEFELNVIPLPPPGALVCVHCRSVDEALRAKLVAMQRRGGEVALTACELIDDKILACTKDNAEQARNRQFVVGEPGAVLVVELKHADPSRVEQALADLERDLRAADLGYAYPVLHGVDGDKVRA